MKFFKIPIYALATIFVATPTLVLADEGLEEAELYFELNDSDGDLGIHGFGDGDEWKEFEIEDPWGREMMEVEVRGRLKRQGLTEIFFESAEPCFPDDCDEGDEGLDPEVFFKRFPQGWYEIEAETLDGDELENRVYLSHKIPAAPEVDTIDGVSLTEDQCTVIGGMNRDVEIVWEAVTRTHEDLGRRTDNPLGRNKVIYYEFVVEVDETPWKTVSIIPPAEGEVSMTIPKAFFDLAPAEEYKFEILVRVDNGRGNPGNKSAVEDCFAFVESDDELEP